MYNTDNNLIRFHVYQADLASMSSWDELLKFVGDEQQLQVAAVTPTSVTPSSNLPNFNPDNVNLTFGDGTKFTIMKPSYTPVSFQRLDFRCELSPSSLLDSMGVALIPEDAADVSQDKEK